MSRATKGKGGAKGSPRRGAVDRLATAEAGADGANSRVVGHKLHTALTELVEPLLEAAGFELVDLEFQGGHRPILRVFIDRAGDGKGSSAVRGVTIDDCVRASRLLEPALDADDYIATAYSLEVSSPGIERPLRKARDFQRFSGEKAKVVYDDPEHGRRVAQGRLLEADDSGFDIDCEGVIVRLEYHQVDRANLVFEFGSPKR